MAPKIKIETPSCESCAARLNNVFCTLSDDEAHDMSIDKSSSFYKKGQLVFFEGNRPSGLYCINRGKVKVYQIGTQGKEQIVRLAKEGDILGYRSLISGESYNASATAIEDSVLCYISRKTFFDLLQENSELSSRVMQLLSHDLRTAETRITALAQKPVRERLAETILTLKEFYGTENDGATINATLTREDIANIVGTATETAIRLLSEFKDEKLIDLVGKKIKILNRDKIVKAANVYD
jgi:CRP-like cAMP-binding protein